jgi:hypothetical protein
MMKVYALGAFQVYVNVQKWLDNGIGLLWYNNCAGRHEIGLGPTKDFT